MFLPGTPFARMHKPGPGVRLPLPCPGPLGRNSIEGSRELEAQAAWSLECARMGRGRPVADGCAAAPVRQLQGLARRLPARSAGPAGPAAPGARRRSDLAEVA